MNATEPAAGRRRESRPALVDEGTVRLENDMHASSGRRWRAAVLAASEPQEGVVVLAHAKADSYGHPNRNTTTASYELAHGAWDCQMGDRTPGSIGIDWEAVRSVAGATYPVRGLLSELGFVFDARTKTWVRPGA